MIYHGYWNDYKDGAILSSVVSTPDVVTAREYVLHLAEEMGYVLKEEGVNWEIRELEQMKGTSSIQYINE